MTSSYIVAFDFHERNNEKIISQKYPNHKPRNLISPKYDAIKADNRSITSGIQYSALSNEIGGLCLLYYFTPKKLLML